MGPRLFVLTLTAALVACGDPPGPPPDATTAPDLPLAVANDNTRPAGTQTSDTLDVELELVHAAWMPRGEEGPRVPVPVFAEVGQGPSVPGPLIRVRSGTVVRLTLHNRLANDATVDSPLSEAGELSEGGLRPGIELDAGATRTVTFRPTRTATSVYRARVGLIGRQGTSSGVIVVDPEEGSPHPDERILHIESWGSRTEPGSLDSRSSWKLAVNGRSWPYTERFDFTVGDTVRWRVVNSSLVRHPMHLHGFFFDVTSAGDLRGDTLFEAGSRAPVVTHVMLNQSAMTLRWVPAEAGNWIFHCHLMRHMGPGQQFAAEADREFGDDAMSAMAGLVTGITVRPHPDDTLVTRSAVRRIDLWTASEPGGWGDAPRLAFVQQAGPEPPAAEGTLGPSSTLVLRRDEPTEIVVHNRWNAPLSVHWHGLELASLYDGVGDWSGMPGMTRPPIPPGGEARVVLQPPRSGTFMYHTHGEQGHELAQGLYGAFIVLDPETPWNAEVDRVYMLGSGGAAHEAGPAVNGFLEPDPERFEPGGTYRLRFAQISPDESKIVRLLRDGEPVTWTPVAKDGADLTPAQRVLGPARVRAEVGETFDFEWAPAEAGVYQLEIKTVRYPLDGERGATQTIAFAVGAVDAEVVAAAHEGFEPPLLSDNMLMMLSLGTVVLVVLAILGGAFWLLRKLIRWWSHRRAVVAA